MAQPLIERDVPLQMLRDRWAGVPDTGGHIVLVSGESGIGKSSLIQAFVATLAQPERAAIGWCDPLDTPRPLGPVRDLARRLLGEEADEPDEARHFDGLLRRLERRQTGTGVQVLVLEDLHWVDQRTLDWLQFIGRRISQLPVLLIGTWRDNEVPADHPLANALAALPPARRTHLALQPLSAQGVRELAARAGPEPTATLGPALPDAAQADAVHRLTGGNPLFVTELLKHAHAATPTDPHPAAPLPATVADSVQAQLNALPEPTRHAVTLVAVCPGGTPQDLLPPLLAKAALPDDALDEALRRRLLVPTGDRLQFRHELVRQAACARLTGQALRHAHRQLLDALLGRIEQAAVLDLIVHHARGAGAHEVLLTHAPWAARRAAAYGAHREAAQHLASAMDAATQAPPAVAADIQERWAYEAGLALGIDDAVIAARHDAVRLWQQAGRNDKVGENLAGLSRLHWYRGEAAQAQGYIQQAIAVLETEAPSSAKARAHALRAQFAMLQDRMAEAVRWGLQALAIADQAGDAEMRAHALNTVGSARLFRADPGGETLLRESLALSLRHGLHEQAARVYTNLSECLIELRALDRAEALLAEGIAFDTAHDLDAWTYYLVGRKAQLRFEQGRYAEARAIAEGVLGQPHQTLLMRMPARIVLARTLGRLGDAAAPALLADALADAEQIGEPQYLVVLHVARIEAAVLDGHAEPARASVAWMRAVDPGTVSPRKWGEYLFWCHLGGIDPRAPVAAAQRTADASSNTLSTHTLPGAALPPAFAHLLAGRYAEAAAAFDAESSDHLAACTRAHAAKQAHGAHHPQPLAARGPYAAARAHPYGLTAKEQRVLALLVEGRSNAAIAEALNRSRRTVENHVSAILGKLQAGNRLEVVLRAQSEPWILPPADDAASSEGREAEI